ncbi:mucin-7-like [Hordeum vulgare subsp. vulgare]|uniref:mucin-7-like n=1 Tax=Hordeum vulgare subsp. vulgare TaxID=112509 RepID=UPI001D1A4749|nr:mucin-7-like [Hordeum vulgare subsp. vulgare]
MPMQMAIAVTSLNPHRGRPTTDASSPLKGSSSSAPDPSSMATLAITTPPLTTPAPRSSTLSTPTHLVTPPRLDEGAHVRSEPEGMAPAVATASGSSPPPSPSLAYPTQRGVIFSPSIQAGHESAMAEVRALSSSPPTPGGDSASEALAEGEVQPLRSSTSSPHPSTRPLGVAGTVTVADVTPSPLRRSGRHSIGVDGTTTTDEDSMAKVMRRTAARNLDFKGYSCMYTMAPYLVYPAEAGGQGPFYDGVYTTEAYGQGGFLPPWMTM